MYKFLLIFCLFFISPHIVIGQETAINKKQTQSAEEDWFKTDEALLQEVSKADVKLIPEMPECHNEKLLQRVLDRIAKYYDEHPVNNIIDKRRQALMLKNLKDFKPVDIATFNPKENYSVSDQIISYKINKGLKEEEMRLCRSSLPRAIYLLIYPQGNVFIAEIINFPGMPISKDFTAIYN